MVLTIVAALLLVDVTGALVLTVSRARDIGWLWPIVRERATREGNWMLRRRQRLWYTIKATLCLLAGRSDDDGYGPDPNYLDEIEVAHDGYASTYSFEFGPGGSMDYFAVGPGVRSGWWYRVGYAAWP